MGMAAQMKLTFDIPEPPANYPLGPERWGADVHAAIGMQIHKLAQMVAAQGTIEAGYVLPVQADKWDDNWEYNRSPNEDPRQRLPKNGIE